MSKRHRELTGAGRAEATLPAAPLPAVEEIGGTEESMAGLPGPTEQLGEFLPPTGAEVALPVTPAPRRPPEQTPGHDPGPPSTTPVIQSKVFRGGHVLCRVGPGAVKYGRRWYPEGSVAEFPQRDADSLSALTPIE